MINENEMNIIYKLVEDVAILKTKLEAQADIIDQLAMKINEWRFKLEKKNDFSLDSIVPLLAAKILNPNNNQNEPAATFDITKIFSDMFGGAKKSELSEEEIKELSKEKEGIKHS